MRARLVFICAACLICHAMGLNPGMYGGQHWKMTMNEDLSTGSIEGDCSLGTMSNITQGNFTSGVGTNVNFTMQLKLQFEVNGGYKAVNVTNGLLGTDNATLTGTFTAGTYSENFKVVHLASADIFKCISSAPKSTHIGIITATVSLLAIAWQ